MSDFNGLDLFYCLAIGLLIYACLVLRSRQNKLLTLWDKTMDAIKKVSEKDDLGYDHHNFDLMEIRRILRRKADK